jgi:putative lipoprotein
MATATGAAAQARAPAGVLFGHARQSRLPGVPVPADEWFGEDKIRHLGSSAAIQLMGFGLLRLAGAPKRASHIGATLVTAAAGIGKEVRDARGGGTASARDLVWDGLGLLAGTGLSRLGDGR